MNANELKVLEDSLKVIEQLQAEKEALEKRVDEVKDTNGTLVDLVQLQRQEINKLHQQQAEIEALKAHPVKELTREDRLKLIGTLKWAEDLLREAGHDEAVSDAQDCLMILRKAQE